MPALQTTYGSELSPALAGMIANTQQRRVLSRVLQSVSAAFGAPLLRGTADNQVATTGAGAFIGIAILDPTVQPADNNAYGQGETVAVLIGGEIWVVASVAVTPGQAAYFTSAGAWTNVSTANTAAAGWVFNSTAGIGALARVIKL